MGKLKQKRNDFKINKSAYEIGELLYDYCVKNNKTCIEWEDFNLMTKDGRHKCHLDIKLFIGDV